jgi:hypothetical protein
MTREGGNRNDMGGSRCQVARSTFFSARHPVPGSVIPDLIRDRDDGPRVHVERLKIPVNPKLPVSRRYPEAQEGFGGNRHAATNELKFGILHLIVYPS